MSLSVSRKGLREGFREFAWDRWLIFAKALLAMGAVFYPVWWIHIHVVAGRFPTLPLSLAVSFLGVQILIILIQLLASSATKKLDSIQRRRSIQFRSVVQRALATHVSGHGPSKDLKSLRRKHPADFDWSLAALLGTVTGRERLVLSDLAVKLGAVRRWQRYARLGKLEHKTVLEWMAGLSPAVARVALKPLLRKRSPAAQSAAYRALIRSSDPTRVGDLFREVLRSPLLVRILLAADFRSHTDSLAGEPLTAVFELGEEREVIAALEMVASWRRVLDLPLLTRFLRHANPEIRRNAVRVAPLASARHEVARHILRALDDPHSEVRMAALDSITRMQVRGALPAVRRAAESTDDAISRQACKTLASFGSDGQAMLEYFVVAGDRRIANWAAEALVQARVSSGLARVVALHA